jgi:hypothetical protein
MGEVVTVESAIEQVVVYASGARIRRVATVQAQGSVVRFAGLPLAVIDDTVRSELDGPATVLAMRVGDDVAATAAAAEESPELRAARRRVALAETEVERLDGALQQVTEAPIVVEDPSDDPPAAWAAVVAARRTLIAARAERELVVRGKLGDARRELDEARRALEVAAERDRAAGTMRDAKLHEPRKYVELELQRRSSGDVTIHIEYQVAAARWAPSYVARLDGEQLRFELRAVVAQSSGEDGRASRCGCRRRSRSASRSCRSSPRKRSAAGRPSRPSVASSRHRRAPTSCIATTTTRFRARRSCRRRCRRPRLRR